VDLSREKVSEEPLDSRIGAQYLGGTGYGARMLYNEVPPTADPLGVENKLIFMTGPMTATRFPTTARYVVVTKSPLTGIMVNGSSSGYWGMEFKNTGHDGIIIEGKSPKPVYLYIKDDQVEIKDASHLWGEDALATQDLIRQELGDQKIRVACIGPAGEKQVLLACIINDEGRAPGRGGNGAVMGSKNLKAIAVRGSRKVELANEFVYNEIARKVATSVTAHPTIAMLSTYGTANGMDTMWVPGDIPIKNWQEGGWVEGCINLGGKKMAETILKPHAACWNCPIRCARWVKVDEPKYAFEGGGPEYETLGALGSMCLIDNMNAVAYAGHLCNQYGMDTIGVGCTIAFAMEAFEKGVITTKDTGGIKLTWGNVEAMIDMVELMGQKKGIGELLGQGTRKAAQKLGQGSDHYAVNVKGMEVPMHDPRAFFSMAANYATGPRGACHLQGIPYIFEMGIILPEGGIKHLQGRFDKDGKGLAAKAAQCHSAVINSLVTCLFAALGLQPSVIGFLMGACTGQNYTAQEIVAMGERILNLIRVYNLRAGITGQDDRLPPRLLEPTKEGGHAGKVPDIDYQIKDFYRVIGWDERGVPMPERLKQIGLEDLIPDLPK
jgi:aldehyde:ferredoxin oxidoreductase